MIEIFYADKSEIKIDLKEVFYYLGYKSAEPKGRERQLIESTVEEIWKNLSCKACFDSFRFLVFQGGVLDFGFAKVQSESLEKALAGCKEAIIFTATVGFEVDRIIQRYSVLSPSKAAAAQAAGAAAIEAFCDLLCKNFSITKKADLHRDLAQDMEIYRYLFKKIFF